MPPGQPAGGGPPARPPGGGGGPPAGGPPGGTAPIPAAAAAPNLPGIQNGALKGAVPTTFDGDRAKTDQFIREFGLYCVVNLDNTTIVSPFRCVALALIFMCGPKVDDWVIQYIDHVGTKVYSDQTTNPPTPAMHQFNDEQLWMEFVADFHRVYSDTAEAEGAYAKLMALSMKDGDGQLDNYIAEFETLLQKARWECNMQGAVNLFKQGLKLNLHRGILCHKTLPQTLDEWIHAARLEAERMALVKATLGPMGGGNITTRQNRLRAVQNPTKAGGSKRKDPDAMEVDTVRTNAPCTNQLLDEERQRLLKEGRCFNCKKLGHMMRTCPDKQRMNGSANNRQGGQTTTPSHPAQGTSRARTAIINKDEEDTKEEKGKEKEDAPLAYKLELLIEHIKRLNAMDRENLLERLALKADF
jgi:Zinc knuckle